MICLTQSYRQSGIKDVEPCGVIRVFAAVDKCNGTTKLITEVQKEADRLFSKLDFAFNCRFTIEVIDDKYGCWMIGDGYAKTNTTE